MNQSEISNLQPIEDAYNSMEKKIDDITEQLRREHADFISENVYYKPVKMVKLVLAVVGDIVLLSFLLFKGIITDALINSLDIYELQKAVLRSEIDKVDRTVGSFLGFLLILLLTFCLYRTAMMLYSRKMDGYGRRINKLCKDLEDRLSKFRADNIRDEIIAAAERNEEYKVAAQDDIGREIAALRHAFQANIKNALVIKQVTSIGVYIIAFVVVCIFMLIKFNGVSLDAHSGFAAAVIFLMMTAVLNLMMFNSEEYLGKFSKLIGSGMAILYGVILMISLKPLIGDQSVRLVKIGDSAEFLNNGYMFIPIIQVLSILLTIWLSHYGKEKNLWNNGIDIMAYDYRPTGTKGTIIFRGGLSTFWTLLICGIVAATPDFVQAGNIIVLAILWYMANTLLKPSGSYLYSFWGRKRAIANEVVMFAMVVTTRLLSKGAISHEEIIALETVVVLSTVIGVGLTIL